MTICDIAKAAGVSIATVSRVVNGTGYVKAETREKVEAVIKEYDYCPNAVARSLIRKESNMIGLIMPERVNPLFVEIIDSIERKAEEEGLQILFFNTDGSLEKEYNALQAVRENQVRGLLIISVIGSDERNAKILIEIEESGTPVVLIDRDVAEGCFDAVFINDSEAVYEASKALAKVGHRRVGIITSPEFMSRGRRRIDGFIQCQKEFGLSMNQAYIYPGDFTLNSGYDACEYFMKLPVPPTGILSLNSSETLGCIKYFKEHEIQIGKDIGLIGFDDISTLTIIGYPVSAIARPMREMGGRAFSLLMDRIRQGKKSQRMKEIILQTHLVLRGSELCDHI